MAHYISSNIFLFSIDLEDVRLRLKRPDKYEGRVPLNAHRYLDWLSKRNQKCTFFVTGNVATLYPSLIKDIKDEGHEIACHSYNHDPINKLTQEEFLKDLEDNLNSLKRAGAERIEGYRAPTFSLTNETKWVYDILLKLNFSYSSSVLPAKNPLYGWESFGFKPKKINDKLVEIPLTVCKFGALTIPVVGGVYFRAVPFFIIKDVTKKCIKQKIPVVGYFHPYDIDNGQERFMHPDINDNSFFNFLMYYRRGRVFEQLDQILNQGFNICTYANFVNNNFKKVQYEL